MELIKHSVSLSVGIADSSDSFQQVHQDLSELARNLGEVHPYVSVSVVLHDDKSEDDEDGEVCDHEHLRHDDQTLVKVRNALADSGLTEEKILNAITAMQNAGILFRERYS